MTTETIEDEATENKLILVHLNTARDHAEGLAMAFDLLPGLDGLWSQAMMQPLIRNLYYQIGVYEERAKQP